MEKKPDELTNDKNDKMLNFSQKLEMGKKRRKFFFFLRRAAKSKDRSWGR